MARPTKEGLGYFPLDTDIDQDEKIIVVVAKFSMRGFGVIIRIMMEIYKNGYYYHWTEKEQYIFSMKVAEPVEFINEVVQECLKWGFFHQEMYEKQGILTSKGFQKRYVLAVTRRKEVMIKPEHNLLDDNPETNEKPLEAIEPEENQPAIKKKARKNKKVYTEDSLYLKFANYFFKKVLLVAKQEGLSHLVIKADMQKWADEIRKLIEIDNQDKQLVKEVMDWVTVDNFWKTNVLSAKKLRDKFTDLAIKMKSNQNPKQQNFQQLQKQDSRDKDIEFQRWVANGGDPADFNWD